MEGEMNGTRVLAKRGQTKRRVTAMPPRRAAVPLSRATRLAQHPRFTWYAGLAVMAALEIIEWPLAILMIAGHEIAHRTHSQELRELAEGVEAAA